MDGNYSASCAMDLGGIDQAIAGTSPVVIEPVNVIWDDVGCWNQDDKKWDVPADGVYLFDGGFKVRDILNCTKLRISIWLEDDEWWVLREIVNPGEEFHFSLQATMNGIVGDRFHLRITLEGADPTCTIDGSDDYSAFGWTFLQNLLGE